MSSETPPCDGSKALQQLMEDAENPELSQQERELALGTIREILNQTNLITRFKGRPLEYAEQILGLTFPPKSRKLIEDVCLGRVRLAIVKANRGGGKSYNAAFIEHYLWLFENYDAVNLGGSEIQATIVYDYQRTWYLDFPEVGKFVDGHTQKKRTMHVDGNLMRVLAATEFQVRGPHVGGADRGGLMVLDEECETAPDIVAAALPITVNANPAVVLRLSTFHKATGTYQEVWDNTDELGYAKYDWNIFDTCKSCNCEDLTPKNAEWLGKPRLGDCETCIPEFAYDCWRTVVKDESGKPVELQRMFVPSGEEPTIADRRYLKTSHTTLGPFPEQQFNANAQWQLETKAFCGGRALHGEGWIGPDQLVNTWRQDVVLGNVHHFLVEHMGERPPSGGTAIEDQEAWEAAFIPDAELWQDPSYVRSMEGCYAIDWGMGQCAIGHFYEDRGTSMIILREIMVLERGQGIEEICGRLQGWRELYGHNLVYPDSSHNYENKFLAERGGFDVQPRRHREKKTGAEQTLGVEFQQEKEYQVGVINQLLRQDGFRAPFSQAEELLRQGKRWRRDDKGHIQKGDDHCCDMLICGTYMWRDWKKSQPRTAERTRRERERVSVPMMEM